MSTEQRAENLAQEAVCKQEVIARQTSKVTIVTSYKGVLNRKHTLQAKNEPLDIIDFNERGCLPVLWNNVRCGIEVSVVREEAGPRIIVPVFEGQPSSAFADGFTARRKKKKRLRYENVGRVSGISGVRSISSVDLPDSNPREAILTRESLPVRMALQASRDHEGGLSKYEMCEAIRQSQRAWQNAQEDGDSRTDGQLERESVIAIGLRGNHATPRLVAEKHSPLITEVGEETHFALEYFFGLPPRAPTEANPSLSGAARPPHRSLTPGSSVHD
ncbi:hypothetical protein B0H19DRAFT_1082347 [Mycena capillaripes]|nr:hypothetical protein B0H19DRAFT_1082347 [Mycena capillaripes]